MENTYSCIHLHIVFAVQNRKCLITDSWKEQLYCYITAIVQNRKHKLLAIGGMPDHLHLLIGFRPEDKISDLMREVKGCSSKWINQKGFIHDRFSWQQGYGAFSVDLQHVKVLIRYIKNQTEHHKKETFLKEYRKTLDDNAVEYKVEYLFKPIDFA